MQLNSFYLYSNKLDVFTNPAASWTAERFRKVYNRNIKIYRGVDNRLDFQVKSGDEKSVNLTGSSLVFNLISADTSLLTLKKDCQAIDSTLGKYTVELTESELFGIDPGFYNYSLVKELRSAIDDDNHLVTDKKTLYVDSQYGGTGTIEIVGDVTGKVSSSTEIKTFSRVVDYDSPLGVSPGAPLDLPRPNYARHTPTSGYEEYYVSSIVDTNSQLVTANSLHTFQFYFDTYDGSVTIQGSIDEQGATPKNWVDVVELSSTEDQFVNITGKWHWFRIKHVPTQDNTGTLDKVLYR